MLKLFISILVCQCAGVVGVLFTRQSIPEWYAFINKPAFNPPNWVFAPVWTILYTMMGVAVFLVWRKGLNNPEVRGALLIFILQLVLNSLWSIVFFGNQSIVGGMVVIVLLWLVILWTMIRFFTVSKFAGALLVPYIAWVSFALILNVALVVLN
jgi:benzodiazapine receptor